MGLITFIIVGFYYDAFKYVYDIKLDKGKKNYA